VAEPELRRHGKEHDKHGLGCGDGTVTIAATLVIVVLVAWLARSGSDVQRQPEAPGSTQVDARPQASVPSQYGAPYRGPVTRDAETID